MRGRRGCSTADDFPERLPSVHRALYLLFNEGYQGASAESAIRLDLCREAMRLTAVLVEHPLGARLASEGLKLLELSAAGSEVTEYDLEAAIAAVHARALKTADTHWNADVFLYDSLVIVALDRATRWRQNEGPARGLEEIGSIADRERLASYPFYPATFGALEFRAGKRERARDHFQAALALARNPMEHRFLQN